jgi:NTE family protein
MTEALATEIGQLSASAPTMPEDEYLALFAKNAPQEWPRADHRITGVSITTGARVVWEAGGDVPLGLALAASCCVPGLFPPVTIGADRYIDGGVWSVSNADLLLDDALDAVLFIGPIAGEEGLGRIASASFQRELADLADKGVRTHALIPRVPFAGASLMDASQREAGYATGVDDGRAAANAVLDLLA